MKNVLKGIVAHHVWRHRQHKRFLHKVGATTLALGRWKTAMLFGAIAMGAEYLRRRNSPAHAQVSDVHDSL
jgi:hypothetical protein